MHAVEVAAPAGPATATADAATEAGARHRYRVEEVNRALTRAVGRPRTVLDVGCGIGLNGAWARRNGARVTGLELAPTALAAARTRLEEVLAVDIRDPAALARALAGRKFDVLFFGDVLEHLVDPGAVLRSLLPYLEDGGHVLVSVPNVAAWPVRLELLRGRFRYTESGILDETHLRFFTRETLTDLVGRAGLEVLRLEHNPMLVRAAKDLILRWLPEGGAAEPTALSQSLAYKLYELAVRPLEDVVLRLAPDLLSFQHVVVARKPPRRGRLGLTVGLLTMDEEESVARMIAEVRSHAPDAEILCVDSSTKDRTPDIARSLGARVLRQVPPRGHGPAMELLMYEAARQSELLIYLDCDFTYPPSYIPIVRRLVEEEGADVVNCCRTRTRPAAMPVPNYLANRAFAALAHALHGVPTVDVHSGMRAYRTSVIRAFDFVGDGDALPIDTLLYPAKSGYRVVEMPIDYDERVGVSKLRKLAGTVWTFARLAGAYRIGGHGAARFERR
ncbi:MAG: methyltransferase domain-containing protein [Polyangiaceae bacterium]|nr:methyltransferase domain-containing protein [Polyangiaceae bacterium]